MYLLYRIDLANDAQSLELVNKCYAAVNTLLGPAPDGPYAEVDTTVGNAARILRIGGTTNRKGDPTTDRPHRECCYFEPAPEQPIEVVPREVLLELAASVTTEPKQKSPASNGKPTQHHTRYSKLDVPRYLSAHGVEFTTKSSTDRMIYKVPCPFDSSHGTGGESAIFQSRDGLLTFECKHKSCSNYQWRDYRDAVGKPAGSHYDPPLDERTSDGPKRPAGEKPHDGETEEEVELPAFATSLLSSADFDRKAYRMEFLVKDVLVASQPCVLGGRSKSCKTSVAVDLAVSLGSGTPFLGHFETKPCRVGFWSGESGAAVIQGKARQCAKARDIKLADCSVFWSFFLPKLGRLSHIDAMQEAVQLHSLDVVMIDPLYLSLLDGTEAGKTSDLFFMGSKLLPVSELAQRTGITVVLLHHFRKSGGRDDADEATALEELSQSGISEWARQWLLVARQAAYQHDGRHELWMRAGGSAGHAGLYSITIDEGVIDEHFDGRDWDVLVEPAAEAIDRSREERARERAERKVEDDREKQQHLIEALRKAGRGVGLFKSGLHTVTGISEKRIPRLLYQLAAQGIVEECEALQASHHKRPKAGAYRLTDDWWNDA